MSDATTCVANACCKCGCAIEPLSADPGLWAVWISLPGDNGENKCYHAKCIVVSVSEIDQLRTQLNAWQSAFGTTQLTHALAERDRLKADNARKDAEIVRLKDEVDANDKEFTKLVVLCFKQHQMLRAFRKSMDSNLPFPSIEKLTEVINQLATINAVLGKDVK